MTLAEKNRGSLDYWIADLECDHIVRYVLKSRPFQRLKNISFLGALDHISATCNLEKTTRTRASHSLIVAALANFIATERGYSPKLKRHLVVAGLLHDVGHAPLSHSAEPYFETRFGLGHHKMGELILKGRHSSSKQLFQYLSRELDIDWIIDLLNGAVSEEQGGDLFSSPVNIDTIDGIIRSHSYMSDDAPELDPLKVAMAAFLDDGINGYQVLDTFWNLKNRVYTELINADIGLLADKTCQQFFSELDATMDEAGLFEDELQWAQKYAVLFKTLNRISSSPSLSDKLASLNARHIKRNYWIDKSAVGLARYRCSKEITNGSYTRATDSKCWTLKPGLTASAR